MDYGKKIEETKLEIIELEKQIKQFEFQQKKEEVERKKDIDVLRKDSEIRWERIEKQNEFNNKRIQHLLQLVGVSFEELDELDERMFSASVLLGKRLKRNQVK